MECQTKMEYREIEKYILEIPRFTKKNAPEDTERFLRYLGDPCLDTMTIHIAGTNGKGSVCAYLSSILTEAGYRVGMFTSPHLVTMRERFRICGEMITEEVFAECFCLVKEKLDRFREEEKSGYHPTFFEILFFMAMECFAQEKADIILLETGLGGRLDATNSVSRKDLCVITEIGLDHMEYLGDTIAQIAGEKAGILRPGVPVVYADNKPEASGVIKAQAGKLGCPCHPVSKDRVRNILFHKNFIDFSFESRYYGYVKGILSTGAPYQAENASLALTAVDVLADRLHVTKEQITEGLASAHWEARMEEIMPGVYVDGAHNEDGVRAFLDAVRQDQCTGKRYLLFSAVADKRYRQMISLLQSEGLFEGIWLAELDNPRGLSLEEMHRAFAQETGRGVQTQIRDMTDVGQAFREVVARKTEADRVYIAGSLYLAGEIKSILC